MDPRPEVKPDPRAALPAVDRLAREVETATPQLPRWAVLEAVRQVLDSARAALGRDEATASGAELRRAAELRAAALARPHPTRVVNATGIVLHTNLGRAPLPPEAAAAVARAAQGYGDLELDLETGERGSRTDAAARKLRLLTGAGGAAVVNNNAGAVLLALAALARGGEVVVSRGELVEIGGSFRIPDILAASGARLVEVGTTNRTHLRDYEQAIGSETSLLLKVHRSNFDQQGFVKEVSLAELAALGAARSIPVVEDLGSGTVLDLSARGWPEESNAAARLRQGADLVCFSADKLMGGPQAGLILTREAELAARLRAHPLARALRLDKLTLAALDWTLTAYLEGRAEQELPVLRQLLAPEQALERQAQALAGRLAAVLGASARVEVQRERSFAGGGSLPGFALPAFVVVVEPRGSVTRCAARLRKASPPVLARIRGDALLLDVRSLLPGDEKPLEDALRAALV
jgi:L-seryl-tRNA(Ser) seleniumtransferase